MFAEAAMAAFRAAVVALGWRPGEFWEATPEELLAALVSVLGEDAQDRPLGRAELERLMGETADGG